MFKEFLSVFVENVLLAFAPLLASLAAAWLLAKARKAWLDFKELHNGEAWMLEEIASLAVKAAEQAKLSEFITDKKAYACKIATEWLKARGLNINVDLIDAAIEAAVFTEFNKPAIQ